VGLTESKIKDLEDKKFHKLYDKHKDAWLEMVQNAFDFAKKHISAGKEPRPDDILKALLPMLEVDTDLRGHQEDNKARFRHFREYFGEYIIDKFLEN
jgi:hypothetical protein